MIDEWRQIPFAPKYEISNFGQIRGPNGIKKLGLKNGYPRVSLYCNSKWKDYYVHILLMETFVGSRPDECPEIRHLDGNKMNCRLDNLLYGTYIENQNDKIIHGTHNRGERQGRSKLKENDVVQIRKLLNEKTQKELGKLYNVTQTTISMIKLKKIWCHNA